MPRGWKTHEFSGQVRGTASTPGIFFQPRGIFGKPTNFQDKSGARRRRPAFFSNPEAFSENPRIFRTSPGHGVDARHFFPTPRHFRKTHEFSGQVRGTASTPGIFFQPRGIFGKPTNFQDKS